MGTSRNWLRAKAVVERMRLTDLAWAARQDVLRLLASVTPGVGAVPAPHPKPPAKPSFVELHRLLAAAARTAPETLAAETAKLQAMLAQDVARPEHPLNWHRNRVAEEMGKPEVREIYFRTRQALWQWAEFASVPRGARAILEVVIELAREEAFPWYLPVPADEVRRLARLTEGRYATSVRALEVLSITKSARILKISDRMGQARWDKLNAAMNGAEGGAQTQVFEGARTDYGENPGTANDEAPPVAQWVVRYRRGVPWHKHRAAWWLNYDLFCGTGRVLSCFVMSPMSLPQTYQARNTPGPRAAGARFRGRSGRFGSHVDEARPAAAGRHARAVVARTTEGSRQ